MDKNVGSVDIEELKRAREELNRERGIESDPNMYSNYNPEAHQENAGLDDNSIIKNPEESADAEQLEQNENSQQFESNENNFENADEEQTVESKKDVSVSLSDFEGSNSDENLDRTFEDDEKVEDFSDNNAQIEELANDDEKPQQVEDSAKDLSIYDSFSDFEVNSGVAASTITNNQPDQEETVDNQEENAESFVSEQSNDSGEKIDLSNFDLQPQLENSDNQQETLESLLTEFTMSEQERIKEAETASEEKETEVVEEATPLVQPGQEEIILPEVNVYLENRVNEANNIDMIENDKTTENQENEEDGTQIVNSFKQLEELLSEGDEEAHELLQEYHEVSEEHEALEEEYEESQSKIVYNHIESFKFVEAIAEDSFKNSDKLSYIIGKDENGELVFGNLRDSYNVAVFGKETDELVGVIHSMLLSLILKNEVSEVNFVICDSKADSKFDCYNQSTYMYFNRIAKTNKEILDTLIEVSKELEERYKLLAEIGVKSIEQYNIIAKNDNLRTLPYIVNVFNNYSKAVQLSNGDKINSCLYQILKFGRMVGIYLIVSANTVITSDDINYNLPTRISFRADDVNRSLTTLGVAGAETLPSNEDAFVSMVENDSVIHIKVPTLSNQELELLIENIEE